MPIYTFESKKTGEQFNVNMSMAEREEYVKDNTEVFQVLTNLNIGDPIRLGITRPPSDFQKHVLGKVKAAHPKGDQLEKRYTIPKEI